jgi:uncharacterized protein
MNLRSARHIPLPGAPVGNQRYLAVHEFGPPTARVIYLQAAVHADEVPGSAVLHLLASELNELDAAGKVNARIVLVPCANPLGAAQYIQGGLHVGRFDGTSGINFNRQFPDLTQCALTVAASAVGETQAQLAALVRAACLQQLSDLQCTSELDHWRVALLQLAIGAEWVIDLHCDQEAVLHLYTAPELWFEVESLAREMGSEVQLLDPDRSHGAFDSACVQPWIALAREGRMNRLPCRAVTLELRGQSDISPSLLTRDVRSLLRWLERIDAIHGSGLGPPPCLLSEPRPLRGVESVYAPSAGVFVPDAALGCDLRPGERFGQLFDISRSTTHDLITHHGGVLFARTRMRAVAHGAELAKIAGNRSTRTGPVLSM